MPQEEHMMRKKRKKPFPFPLRLSSFYAWPPTNAVQRKKKKKDIYDEMLNDARNPFVHHNRGEKKTKFDNNNKT